MSVCVLSLATMFLILVHDPAMAKSAAGDEDHHHHHLLLADYIEFRSAGRPLCHRILLMRSTSTTTSSSRSRGTTSGSSSSFHESGQQQAQHTAGVVQSEGAILLTPDVERERVSKVNRLLRREAFCADFYAEIAEEEEEEEEGSSLDAAGKNGSHVSQDDAVKLAEEIGRGIKDWKVVLISREKHNNNIINNIPIRKSQEYAVEVVTIERGSSGRKN